MLERWNHGPLSCGYNGAGCGFGFNRNIHCIRILRGNVLAANHEPEQLLQFYFSVRPFYFVLLFFYNEMIVIDALALLSEVIVILFELEPSVRFAVNFAHPTFTDPLLDEYDIHWLLSRLRTVT